MLSISPLIKQYNDYDTYQFVAAATSTGLVTANVTAIQGQTVQGTFATLKVFKTNGACAGYDRRRGFGVTVHTDLCGLTR